VRDFAETPDGTLWMGTSAQLVRRTPAGQWVKPDSAFWSGRQIWALHAARNGSLWIGSENGLYRYVGNRLYTYGAAEGLQSSFVVAIHEEADGTLWFSTYEDGLHRYRDGRFVAVTTREGLHHNGIWRMLWDERGGIWMSSDQGVFRVEHARLHAVADALEQSHQPEARLDPLVFTESEGLPSRECNRAGPGGWHLADGRLAFNNLRGLVLIDPERALTPPPPPHTTLHRIVADGTTVEAEPGGPATVPAGTKQLRFDFAALSFVAPGQNHYRYRLRGYDEAWVDGGTRPTASYTNLAPDEYVFEVQGASGMSAWGPPTTAALTLRPLLWQAGWFRLLMLGAVAGLLAAAYQYRVQRLLEMERLRLRLAADLHDDVGSNISSIALISDMLKARVRHNDVSERHLQRIHAAAEDTVRALRDIIWLVDPKHDTLADLVRKMRRGRHTLLNGIECTFEVNTPVEPHPLDMDTMRNVFLIYKEALHNIAKHAAAQQVRITVDEQGGRLTLQIQDDGHGFDEAAIERGHGLANMRRRAQTVGGQIAIESTPGIGTRITFTAKMA
jgi:signal transduction histidine kinase